MRGNFSAATIRMMAKRVGYRCSNPECRQPTSGAQLGSKAKAVNVGQAAHIVAASEDGPRGKSPLSLDERRDLGNGIWLCNKCHKLVDDDRDYYTVDMLRNWKKLAEQRAHDEIASLQAPLTATALVLPLPADLPDFTGRQAQIDRVRDRLNQQGTVIINGMGGIGKTALAVHVAHQLIAEGRFRDAQLTIDLKGAGTSPVDPVDALDSLINAILEPDPNRPRDAATLAAIWRRAIDTKDALLILDNAADAVQVRPLLPGCPTCAVLVTSRLRFTLPGVRRLDLRPMQPGEARYLLQELSPHLGDDGADKIAGLCGRLPQALRIAGNYLGLNDDVTSDQYAGMLADERTRLAQLRDPDDPDLDVYATISLSVDQLDEGTRRAWALISLFPAPFDLPAAAALWNEPDENQVLKRLQALRNRSLITYDRDSARYLQHDLVRLAAARELQTLFPEEEAEITAACLRFARHYEQVARAASRLYAQGGDNVLQSLALFDLEWPHIRAGQAWAAAYAEDNAVAALLCILYPDAAAHFLPLRLHPRDRIAWIKPALQAARRLGHERAEGSHLNRMGLVYAGKGEWDRAIEFYEQALEIYEQVEGIHGIAQTTNNLGMVYADKGEWDRAIEFYEQALEIREQVEDIHGMAQTTNNLGSVYLRKGEWDRAIEFYEQALEIYEQVENIHGMAQTRGNLGSVYLRKGEWNRAIEFYEQSLATEKQLGDIHGMASTTNNLGMVYAGKGEWDRAIGFYEQALETMEQVGDIHGIAQTYTNLGDAYFSLGKVREAQNYYTQQLIIAQQIGDPQGQANALWGLGLTHAHFGEVRQAREKYQASLALFDAIGDPDAKAVRRELAELEDGPNPPSSSTL